MLFILRKSVGYQLVHTGIVAHHEAPETPLTAQDVSHQPAVAGSGYAVDLVERGHEGAHACLGGCLVGRQVDVAQGVLGELGGVVVPSRFGSAVGCQVFPRSQQGVYFAQCLAADSTLEPYDACLGDPAAQVGIFTGTLHHAAPAGITTDVHHRGEGPVNAVGSGLDGGDLSSATHHLQVP